MSDAVLVLHCVTQSNEAKEMWLEMDVGDHVTERVEWAEVIDCMCLCAHHWTVMDDYIMRCLLGGGMKHTVLCPKRLAYKFNENSFHRLASVRKGRCSS